MTNFIQEFAKTFLSKKQFQQLSKEGAIVIDVSAPTEFSAGHLENSRNLPLQSLIQKVPQLSVQKKPVIAVCRNGVKSSLAVALLSNAGVEAFNGGAWRNFVEC
ncbi:rhodanese-like domain-containing protein [Danxiaibacter flavus]|uniref:Rhodanese-like domain-containing protein n=1 Tax=Danxiaibacter flavus TaxID=3049108 RepID=A0ABV3ZKA5_9BACT|nr:rhodanese-like domain-containing protein [Chitinophagaceae bacterium DXS]